MDKNIPYLLALHRGINLTFKRYQILRDAFHGDWEKAYKSSPNDICFLSLDYKAKEKWGNQKEFSPEKEYEQFKKSKSSLTLYGEESYPKELLSIPSPPVFLFYKGDLSLKYPAIAIVGSRKISPYSKHIIEKVVPPLVKNNLIIVSGLAMGVDKYAHEQTLKNQGRTIAVMGCGIDEIYPKHHSQLSEKIIESGGCIISEFPPNTPARPEHFPIRNRIISGLSKGVVVVQAGIKSGSIITAHQGLEQGKEIMTFPGSIFDESMKGCHQLLQKSEAGLIQNAQDILDTLNIKESGHNTPEIQVSQKEKIVLSLFRETPELSFEQIRQASQLSKPECIGILTLLEMHQLLRKNDQGLYRK